MRPFPPIEKGTKPRKRTARPAPYTAADFNAEFRNDDLCLEYIKEQRWPAAVTHCVKCGNRSKHHRVTGRTAYACSNCGNQIYPLAGTIFAKSRMPLKKWFYAIYLIGSTDCSITAKQLQREIGVTYKTAWRLSRSIRQLMASEDLTGRVYYRNGRRAPKVTITELRSVITPCLRLAIRTLARARQCGPSGGSVSDAIA